MNTTIINETTNGQVFSTAPSLNGSVNWKDRIKVNDIREYWLSSVGKELLQEDETVRITAVLPWEKNGKLVDSQITIHEQVRSADEFIALMEKKYAGIRDNEWKRLVGWSMSSATFQYQTPGADGKPIAPSKSSVRTLESFVIDMDAHTEKEKGSRFHFNSYNDNSRRLIAAIAVNKINKIFKTLNMDLILKPLKAYATGGGLQFIVKFTRPILANEADKIFLHIKSAAKTMKDRINIYGLDALSNIETCFLDFDVSSTDIAHTQRVSGTVNPKSGYLGSFAEEIRDLYDESKIDAAKAEMLEALDDSVFQDETIDGLRKFYHAQVVKFKELFKDRKVQDEKGNNKLDAFGNTIPISWDIVPDAVMHSATILKHVDDTFRDGDKSLWANYQDYDILKDVSSADQAKFMGSFLNINEAATTARYVSYHCPFHPEQDPSFAIYTNADAPVAYAKDFHDGGEIYNAITFLMALQKITRTEAIHKFALAFGIQLKAAVRKEFGKEETSNEVMKLISEIDTENFVYYRLANKNRACIIREFEQGEAYTFDGTKMMSDHILLHQLGKVGADKELRAVFHEKFEERVLINAFEEFNPGKPHQYTKGFIKYINLWIPGKAYLKIHEMSEVIDQMDIKSALGLIKNRLPVMDFYLHQITQKGSIEYLINWLINTAHFNRMSTLPVITTVQGTGKGVFVTNVLEHYLNHKYVNVVTSEKISSNFNAFMEQSSLIVLDEGDFSKSHEVDNLKLLTGNEFIQVEKKGIDSQKMRRHFNLLMLTNGETPLIHPSNDRRMTYFRGDVTLLDSIEHAGFDTIDNFILAVKEEVDEFWAILLKTTPKPEWNNANLKDNQFNKQILLMHPFGKLIIKMIENEWNEIKLQISENIDDNVVIAANLEMVSNIQKAFESTGTVDLTLINKYIKSLPFKSFVSVQQFIKSNALHKNGIEIQNTGTAVLLHINKYKLKELIKMENNLGKLFDCYNSENLDNTLNDVNSHHDLDNDGHVADILEDVGLAPINNTDPLNLSPIAPGVPAAPSTIMQ
jgi:hypothetical protein